MAQVMVMALLIPTGLADPKVNFCNYFNDQISLPRQIINENTFTVNNVALTDRKFCLQVLNYQKPISYIFSNPQFIQVTKQSVLPMAQTIEVNNPLILCDGLNKNFNQDGTNQYIDYNTGQRYYFCSCKDFCKFLVQEKKNYPLLEQSMAWNFAVNCQMDPWMLVSYKNIKMVPTRNGGIAVRRIGARSVGRK